MYFLILQLVLQKRLVPFSPVVSEMFNCEILEDNGCQVAAIPHMTVTTFIRVVYHVTFGFNFPSAFRGGDSI
jgi:hypothetical protein